MKRRLSLITVLIIFFSSYAGEVSANEKFSIKEVSLSVEHRYMQYDAFLPEFVEKIVVTPEYVAFIASRTVWIKQRNKQLVPLSRLVKLPPGFDWYAGACVFGEKLLISVGNYSEERRRKDLATSRGGYIEGPKPVGMLLVQFRPAKATLLNSIKVVKGRAQDDAHAEPDAIVPKFQSCFYDGKDLYLGEYGYLARIDLDSMSGEFLEFDGELMINRMGIWKEKSMLWYAADEGGMGGSWISKLNIKERKPKSLMSYAIMNDSLTQPDAILRYKSRLLTSSLAGVVEIDENNKVFTQYQLTKDRKTMRVYELMVIQDKLWGLREDGWIQFDLDKGKAIHYQLPNDPNLNNIYSIGYFEGRWYIGTQKQVVRTKMDK